MNDFKELRLSKKLTQQQCAEVLGVSRRTIINLEGDNTDTHSDKYHRYLHLLQNQGGPTFHTSVLLGRELTTLSEIASSYRKRDCFNYLMDYLQNDYRGKVFILFGLRRSGKTTLIYQALSQIDRSVSAYIKVKEGDTMGGLVKDINVLKAKGIRNLFIDEATLLDDFIATSATLSDVYAALGMKVILSGTDSLGFAFAANEELYDRNVMVHTSYIPFREWSYLLGIDDIDQYIEYGGTLKPENMGFDDPDYKNEEVSFRDEESTRKYIDTAISRNIQRSLKNFDFGSRFGHLKALYDGGELTSAINRIIEDMNHEFLLSVVTRAFKSHDLGSSRQILTHSRDEETQTALYDIDQVSVLTRLKEILDIKEKEEQRIQISQEGVNQIREYLSALDLIKPVEVVYGDGTGAKHIVFTQPGMRYSITKALVYSLLLDSHFSSLPEKTKRIIIETILADVKGRMLEDMVLLETSLSSRGKRVFKFIDFTLGEYDMAIYDPGEDQVDIFEIKHSSSLFLKAQAKFLTKEDLRASLQKRFGKIRRAYCLYRGKDAEEEGIIYRNVESFLQNGCR